MSSSTEKNPSGHNQERGKTLTDFSLKKESSALYLTAGKTVPLITCAIQSITLATHTIELLLLVLITKYFCG